MQLDIILEIMYRLPAGTYTLVLFMALAGAILVNHMIDASLFTTIATVPTLLLSGLFGNAFLMSFGVILSHDKASNAALSACFGFVLLALIIFLNMRVWFLLRDKF